MRRRSWIGVAGAIACFTAVGCTGPTALAAQTSGTLAETGEQKQPVPILDQQLPVKAAGSSVALYQDEIWAVVLQKGGKICVIVVKSDDQRRAFHFLIDGELDVAKVEILEKFLSEKRYLVVPSTSVTVDLGPEFARLMEFKPKFDGTFHYINSDFEPSELQNVLAALQSQSRGVRLVFDNGERWQFRPPRDHAAAVSAITQCWEDAAKGIVP